MSHHLGKLLLAVSILAMAFTAPVNAQTDGPSVPPALQATVTGAGAVTVEGKPTAMQVHVELLGKGKTLAEALEHLRQRREAAQKRLESLGAEKESITFGAPTLSNAQSQNRQQMERMIRQQMAAAGRRPKGLKLPTTVTVTASAKAQWKLAETDPEKLLLAVHELQEKVKEADLGGAKLAKELSPEEEELAEEMSEMSYDMGNEQVEPGTPLFVFVARITEEARQEALAKAFEKARDKARRLAAAAGTELGPLVRLDSNNDMGGAYYPHMYRYSPFQGQEQVEGLIMNEMQGADEGRIALGATPDSLTFFFPVSATFGLKK